MLSYAQNLMGRDQRSPQCITVHIHKARLCMLAVQLQCKWTHCHTCTWRRHWLAEQFLLCLMCADAEQSTSACSYMHTLQITGIAVPCMVCYTLLGRLRCALCGSKGAICPVLALRSRHCATTMPLLAVSKHCYIAALVRVYMPGFRTFMPIATVS